MSKTLLILLLALTLTSCSGPRLIASPNYIEHYAYELIDLEQAHDTLRDKLNFAVMMGFDIEEIEDDIKHQNDLYWFYRGAMDTYLVNGDTAALVQARARAEAALAKIETLIKEHAERPEPVEPKPLVGPEYKL